MAGKKQQKGSPAGRGAIRILHLSDFHFSAERRWDSDPVVRELTGAIGKLVSEGLGPDFVAITGDIARKGRPEDYKEACRWMVKGLRRALPIVYAANPR